jgi:hypothetical protein
MYTEFHITPSELDNDLMMKIKELFKSSRRIAITVEEELDETEYLLRSETNRTMLEQSMKEAELGKTVKVN